METLTQLSENLENAKQQFEEAKKKSRESWARITGLEERQILIVQTDFISFKAKSLKDVRSVINSIEPLKNGWEVKHSETHYLTTLYMVTIQNNYHNRTLRIEFANVGGKYWVEVDFKDLTEDFKARFFTETTRGLYSTETHYVNIPSHYKKFKNIRVQAYSFNEEQLSWFGGGKTLIRETEIKALIEAIKKA